MQPDSRTYCFVAYDSEALGDKRAVRLEIRPQDEQCAEQMRRVWTKMYSALKGYHDCTASSNAPGWTRWNVADWYTQKVPDRQKFAAWAGDTVVGFLNLRVGYRSQYDPDKKLIYIEHIATAPGNICTDVWGLRLSSVGTSLMAFAILQSLLQGHEGRVGLHAADADAAAYYTHLARKYKFLREALSGISGTPEDKRAPEHPYFESDPVAACTFLEGYRNE